MLKYVFKKHCSQNEIEQVTISRMCSVRHGKFLHSMDVPDKVYMYVLLRVTLLSLVADSPSFDRSRGTIQTHPTGSQCHAESLGPLGKFPGHYPKTLTLSLEGHAIDLYFLDLLKISPTLILECLVPFVALLQLIDLIELFCEITDKVWMDTVLVNSSQNIAKGKSREHVHEKSPERATLWRSLVDNVCSL